MIVVTFYRFKEVRNFSVPYTFGTGTFKPPMARTPSRARRESLKSSATGFRYNLETMLFPHVVAMENIPLSSFK